MIITIMKYLRCMYSNYRVDRLSSRCLGCLECTLLVCGAESCLIVCKLFAFEFYHDHGEDVA
jgi:hypothetical protein